MNKDLKEEAKIFSMITGKTHEESREFIESNEAFTEKIKDMLKFITETSENDAEILSKTNTVITVMLQGFSMEMRQVILAMVASVSLSGKSDEMLKIIRKFDKK